MRVSQIKYRRNKALRPYEHEHLELVIELNEGDTVADAVKQARVTVAREFGELPDHKTTKKLVDHLEGELESVKKVADDLEHGAFE